jgi:hypothetical protein
MSSELHGAAAGRAELIHRAESHYGMTRSEFDSTRASDIAGPTKEQRDQEEAELIAHQVRYAVRPGYEGTEIRVKCRNPEIRKLVESSLAAEELARVKLC